MKIKGIEAATSIQIQADATRWGLLPISSWAAAAWERGNRWVPVPRLRIRPRVSLLTGSTLVLLTLYVPFAWGCKAPNSTGLQYIHGEGSWPGLFFLDLEKVGRGFYIFTLAMAAFALFVLLASCFHRGVMRKRGLIQGLFAVAGAVSLLVAADSFALWIVLSDLVSLSGRVPATTRSLLHCTRSRLR